MTLWPASYSALRIRHLESLDLTFWVPVAKTSEKENLFLIILFIPQGMPFSRWAQGGCPFLCQEVPVIFATSAQNDY